jgi:dUTP pyrophosphatase
MTNTFYELEIMPLDDTVYSFYAKKAIDQSDANAGFDLHAANSIQNVEKMSCHFLNFGLVARMYKVTAHPMGKEREDSHFWLLPRSSIYKSGLTMANSVGVIDKSYGGELKAPVWTMREGVNVEVGDRLFQIVAPDMGWISEVRLVSSMDATERGANGFGSTGR